MMPEKDIVFELAGNKLWIYIPVIVIATLISLYLSLINPILALLVFFGAIVLGWWSTQSLLVIKPDGTILIGGHFRFLVGKQPLNSFCFAVAKNDTNRYYFTIGKNNIKKAYLIVDPAERDLLKKRQYKFWKAEPKNFYACDPNKAVCIEFILPITLKNNKAFVFGEYPHLEKIYVSVNEPEKLVEELNRK